MLLNDWKKKFERELAFTYDSRETSWIFRLILTDGLGFKWEKTSTLDNLKIETQHIQFLELTLTKLKSGEPIQYILQKTQFAGLEFKVNENVLIPRPETEELVYRIIDSYKKNESELKFLDIGTGSGCIAISLKKHIKTAIVKGIDISIDALKIATFNAVQNKSSVFFEHLDILNENPKEKYDIIVSNPPYIPYEEKSKMETSVTNWEPHIALFTKNDPMEFYDRIAFLGKNGVLNENGTVFLEIHFNKRDEVVSIFEKYKYKKIEVFRDLSGKNRFVKAII